MSKKYTIIQKKGFGDKLYLAYKFTDGSERFIQPIDSIKLLKSGQKSKIAELALKFGTRTVKDKVKKIIKDKSKDLLGSSTIININNNQSVFSIRNDISDKINSGIYNIVLKAGDKERFKQFDIKSFRSWFDNEGIIFLMFNSGESFFEKYGDGTIEIYRGQFKSTDIFKKVYKQSFLDGLTHCLLTPIKNFIYDKIATSKTAKTIHNYKLKKNIIDDLLIKYKDGVPEDNISEITNKLNIDIIINTPFSDKPLIESKCLTNKITTFYFLNSRLNHVEHNELYTNRTVKKNNNTEILNSVDIQTKYDELINNNSYFVYRVNHTGISEIQTLEKIYKLDCRFKKAINKFEIDNDIKNYTNIDAYKDLDLTKFIKDSQHMNGTVDFVNINKVNINVLEHIDMKAAYINYKSNKYYMGFLGKITDFRQCNNVKFALDNIGLYRINNIKLSNHINTINNKLGIFFNDNIYTTCELKFLVDNNCSFDVMEGCWGIKCDIEMNTEEMKEVNNDIKNYCKYFGYLYNTECDNAFYLNCDEEFANIASNNFNGEIIFFDNNKTLFKHKNKHSYHGAHITSFITAYQRLYVIEQIMNMDLNKIVRVCVDGIYYYKHDFIKLDLFNYKNNDKTLNNGSSDYYLQNVNNPYTLTTNEFKEYNNVEFHLGAGGCGKTYANCKDEGSIRKCIFTHSHDLGLSAKNDYNIDYMTHARLFMENEAMNIKRYYNTLIIDEVSMLNGESIHTIINNFSDCKLIFMGDVGYQVAPIKGEEIKDFKNYYVKRYITDYRCKCETLAKVKQILRDNINDEFNIQLNKIINYCNTAKDIINYNKDDIILVSKHELNKQWNIKFKDIEKYKVIENNSLYNVGQIVYDSNSKCRKEFRHGYTVHSVQGRTYKNNIYIDCRSMFDKRLLYTAISRAETIQQITLII
jgi:hypothetical protein